MVKLVIRNSEIANARERQKFRGVKQCPGHKTSEKLKRARKCDVTNNI